MHPALAFPAHQARSVQGLLFPGVAQANLMLASQLLVKEPHVQIEILLPNTA
jgi:hypothetical protein